MTKVTNTSRAVRIVNATVDGKVRLVPIDPGATRDLDPVETPVFKALVKDGVLKYGAKTTKEENTSTFEAKHRGGGSYSIVDGSGNEVVEKLSKEDSETFNAMSDADKAAYVEASKK